jgi:hypothetical protein
MDRTHHNKRRALKGSYFLVLFVVFSFVCCSSCRSRKGSQPVVAEVAEGRE